MEGDDAHDVNRGYCPLYAVSSGTHGCAPNGPAMAFTHSFLITSRVRTTRIPAARSDIEGIPTPHPARTHIAGWPRPRRTVSALPRMHSSAADRAVWAGSS